MERTLIVVKPDGYARGLVGEVVSRIERKGYRLAAARVFVPSAELLSAHYAEHTSKPFYPSLVEFMTSGPVFAAVVEGEQAIAGFRALAGATNPIAATPGTIRGDFAAQVAENVVHGSDSAESATREIGLWFPEL